MRNLAAASSEGELLTSLACMRISCFFVFAYNLQLRCSTGAGDILVSNRGILRGKLERRDLAIYTLSELTVRSATFTKRFADR